MGMGERWLATVSFDVILHADSEGGAQRLALWHLRDALRSDTEDGVSVLQRPISAVRVVSFPEE